MEISEVSSQLKYKENEYRKENDCEDERVWTVYIVELIIIKYQNFNTHLHVVFEHRDRIPF